MTRSCRRLALAATLAVAGVACSSEKPAGAPPAPKAPAGALALSEAAVASAGIAIAAVEQATTTGDVSVPGVIRVDDTRTARIGSLQEGLILKTLGQVGDHVGEGQLLATMHGHAMHDAWAGYRKAMADRTRLETALAYAVDAHERMQRLFAARAVAEQDVRRAAVERQAATQHLVAARAEVVRSIEELEHVGVHVTGTAGEPGVQEADADEPIPVRSPVSGVVLERLVTPGTTVVPGAPLYTVSDLSSLWVVVELDEAYLSLVRAGRPVAIRVAAYPGETFRGTVSFIADAVSPETRRVTVRATVPNRDRRLKPEMFATVSLATHEPRTALLVPRAAIQSMDGTPAVFVAGSDGRFVPRRVTVGAEAGGRVEVTTGLSAGERVVASGGFALKSELVAPSGSE